MALTPAQEKELARRGYSRRDLGKIASLLSAGALLPFYNEPALAQASKVDDAPPDAVMINANENPMGPCAEARDAVHNVVAKGGRYLYAEADQAGRILAQQEGLKETYVQMFAGSSLPLHHAVMAFTSPARPFIIADPGYEAGEKAAQFIGAKVMRVPLAKDYSHDVKAMAAASPEAGLIYICNPNNPTGTLTPKSDIEWLVANKPKGCVVMVDEAYTHIAGAPFNTDLVAADKDVIVLRTFSKIYGMAGLRAGAAIARPDLLAKVTPFSAGGLPITAMVAASTSLQVKNLVPERRKAIGAVREDTMGFLEKRGYRCVPSVSNKFMVDVRRPANDVMMALRTQKVYVGRVWASMPTHIRVSVGTPEEMAKFQTAFAAVMA